MQNDVAFFNEMNVLWIDTTIKPLKIGVQLKIMKAQYPNLEGGHLLILRGIKVHYN